MLEKHKNYILHSSIKDNLENLLNDYFLEWLDEIDSTGELKTQHRRLIGKVLEEIRNLENKYALDYNVFLAKPERLSVIKKNFDCNYGSLVQLLGNYNDKYQEQTYSDILVDAFGYEVFSSAKMDTRIEEELSFIRKKYTHKWLNQYGSLSVDQLFRSVIQIMHEDLDQNKYPALTELAERIQNLEKSCPSSNYQARLKIYDLIKKYRDSLKAQISGQTVTIRNYKEVQSGKWSAYDMIMESGVKVCPYCNENYILPFYRESGKSRPALDHFYAKSLYPFLSMSIYNLVPACTECNSSIKGSYEFDEKFLSIYESDLEDMYQFTYLPQSYDSFWGDGENKIVIMYPANESTELGYLEDRRTVDAKQKISKNHEFFCIEDRYQYHSPIVQQYLKKRMIFSDTYLKEIYQQFSDLFSDEAELYHLLYGVEEDYVNQPLGKLKHDLLTEITEKT